MQTKNKPSPKFIHALLLLIFLFGTAAVRFSEQKSVSAQSGELSSKIKKFYLLKERM